MGYPVYKLIRAVNRQYPNNGFIDYVDVREDMYRDKEEPYTDIIDEDLRDLINEAIHETYIDIARDEVYSFPTVPGQNQYVLPDDCDLRDIQEVTRTYGGGPRPFPPPPPPPPRPDEKVTISFKPNGGTGSMPNMTADLYSIVVLPSCDYTPPAGRGDFLCWQDEDENNYEAGEEYIVVSDMTFKAIWSAVPVDPGRDVEFNINPLYGTFNGGAISITYVLEQGEALEDCPLVIPNEGYTFTDTWKTPEDVTYTTEQLLELAIENNMILEAVLEYNPIDNEAQPQDEGRDPEESGGNGGNSQDPALDDNPLDGGRDPEESGGDNQNPALDDNPLGGD